MIMELRIRERVAVAGMPGAFGATVWHDGDDLDGRDRYGWALFGGDGRVVAMVADDGGDVVRSGRQGCGPREALSALLSFLGADAEAYGGSMRCREAPEDGYLFGEAVAEWAYGVADELAIASCELDGDDA